jgi:hypothetical protein
VTWSPEVRFGPDGRARRAWRPVATQDGAWVDDVREGRYSQVRIRVVLARTVLYEGPVGGVEQGGPRDDDPGPAVLDPALRAARGRPDPALAQIALYGLLDAAGLSSRTSRVGVLWGGRVADQQAVLVTVRTPDGGLLVDGVTGSVDSRDLRLRQVVPADEWGTRAFAWVVPPREQSRGGRTVVVVAPRAAVRAELVQDGTVVPVALTDGAGSADVPREGPPVEVRVVDAEGRVLDARPVLEAEWYHEPVIEP